MRRRLVASDGDGDEVIKPGLQNKNALERRLKLSERHQ
jgi:hypothetical protein